MQAQIPVQKGYHVVVKAYHKQIVPKHCKIFDSLDKAEDYKTKIENDVVWKTPVSIELNPAYYLEKDGEKFLLHGDFVKIE